MSTKRPRGLFITGTDTGVGKTYIAALLARAFVAAGYRVGVYKPVASGCKETADGRISEDAVMLWEAAGGPLTLESVCPQRFLAPLAPHRAAQAEGRCVDTRLLRSGIECWRHTADFVLVEGAGGLLSPLSDEDYNADLALDLGYPLLVVSANVLGTINQTLQTLVTAATFRGGLEVAGIVLNDIRPPSNEDPSRESNCEELEMRAGAPLLAHVAWQADRIELTRFRMLL